MSIKKKKIAIIQFPGSNCEYETARAVESVGMSAEIFRWNRKDIELTPFSGYIIGGGFSYQDRVRAGVIAAKEPIMEKIKEESKLGKPVLGICNGAQILIESGMVPHLNPEEIEMGLAPNRMEKDNLIVRRDYYCIWIYLRCEQKPKKNAFTYLMQEGEVIPIPIAHAEGRFVSQNEEVLNKIIKNNQIIFRYCNVEGEIKEEFPINPNGSFYNIAGLSNKEGNVLALMPHPERANWIKQLPQDIKGEWGKKRKEAIGNYKKMEEAGPGRIIFESMRKYIEDRN